MHYDRPSIFGERFDVIVCRCFSRDSDRSEEKMVSRGTIVQKVHCFESSKNTVRRQTNEISGFSKKYTYIGTRAKAADSSDIVF